jgi:histidinol phosphatase-like PHP family hydrolase
MWHEARYSGHRVLALTDHVSLEDPSPLLRRLAEEASAWASPRFTPLIGVELTKIPPRSIPAAAKAARRGGAQIVIVHGETIVEHVPPGTNRAALESGEVDVLAHPGLLTLKEATLAKANSVVLELSARRGHSLANGHIARLALEAGADLVLDSDAHSPDQLVADGQARRIAAGAGISEKMVDRVMLETPKALFKRCASRSP